jgi:hypothetical protein
LPNPYTYVKAVREMLKQDATGAWVSESPFRFKWGIRNTSTGRWVSTGETTNATKATAESAAHTAADSALTTAQTNQPEGTAEYASSGTHPNSW